MAAGLGQMMTGVAIQAGVVGAKDAQRPVGKLESDGAVASWLKDSDAACDAVGEAQGVGDAVEEGQVEIVEVV